jgi:FkbM family methyltransferase
VKEIQSDLIFDLGAATGDDTAYYLHRGYRVIAVEPNPVSVSRLHSRFAQEIGSGRLTVNAAAISVSEGEAPFWICDDEPVWSSFDRAIASQKQSRHHAIMVATCRFRSLLERFGIPFYCKIDIEGSDGVCLEEMTPSTKPPFVSVEMGYDGSGPVPERTWALFHRLRSLGYTRFKVISQVTYRQPSSWFAFARAHLPKKLSARLTSLDAKFRKRRGGDGWCFDGDSSGPFGDDTDGMWLNATGAQRLIAAIQMNPDASDWFDIHAAE